MRSRLQALLPSVLALVSVSLLVAPMVTLAQAPAISVYPEDPRPGSAVEIVGIGFPAEHVVELELTTPDGTVPLATAATDTEGRFSHMAALPFSATEGAWEVRASAVDGTTSTFGFTAASDASAAGVVESAPVTGPAPVEAPAGNTSGDIAVLLIIAVVLGGLALGAMVVYRQLKDDSPPGMGKGDDLIWGGGKAETPVQTATDEPHWKTTQASQTAPPTQPAQGQG